MEPKKLSRPFELVVFTALICVIIAWLPSTAKANFGGPGSVVEVKVEGGSTTTSREIVLLPKYWSKGKPTHYKICDNPKLIACEWKPVPYYGGIKYTLSEGYGMKTIYFVAKRFGKGVSEVMEIKVNYVQSK